jgi:molybdopterin converting factor small subunit
MVIVRYHALLRERTGRTEEIFQLPVPPVLVSTLLDLFARKHPELAKLTPLLHVAVNNEIVSRETAVSAGDLIDLMPPFGGG